MRGSWRGLLRVSELLFTYPGERVHCSYGTAQFCTSFLGLGPGSLKDCLLPYIPAHTLKSCEGAILQPPPFTQIRGMVVGGRGERERAFAAVAPQLCNSLQGELRSSLSFMSFGEGSKHFWKMCHCLPRVTVAVLFYLFIFILDLYCIYLYL